MSTGLAGPANLCRKGAEEVGDGSRRLVTIRVVSADQGGLGAVKIEAGQVAVVTGGASGLGLALAEALSERGVDLVIADVEEDALEAAVETVSSGGGTAIGMVTDVREPAEVDALARTTLERFGRIDLVCNNAGVTASPVAMWEVPPNDWEWVLAVNLRGVINGICAFVPHLVEQDSGHVVNTASMAGLTVAPYNGPYLASKHAVVALSEALALELGYTAPGVGVTVVCPGMIDTRIATAERNRPSGLPGADGQPTEAEFDRLIEWTNTISGPPISAAEAAAIVLSAVETNTLHVAPNGLDALVRERVDRLLTDLEPG